MATGPTGWTSSRPHSSRSSRRSASLQRLPPLDAAARQQPVGAAVLLCRISSTCVPRWSSAETRRRGGSCTRLSLPGSGSTRTRPRRARSPTARRRPPARARRRRTITSCAMRSPTAIANGSRGRCCAATPSARRGSRRRSARAVQHRIAVRAARGRSAAHEAGVAGGIATARPCRTARRSPGGISTSSAAAQVEAGVVLVGPARAAARRAGASTNGSSVIAASAASRARSGDAERRVARAPRPRAGARGRARPRRVVLALDRRAERVELGRAPRPRSCGTSSSTRSKRPAKKLGDPLSSSSRPSPVSRRDQHGVRSRVPADAGASPRRAGRSCSAPGAAASRSAPISLEHLLDGRLLRDAAPPRRPRRRRRAGSGRRRASPRASTRTPRRGRAAACG